MGVNKWTKKHIPANTFLCKIAKIKPGDYLINYNSSSGVLLIKDPQITEKDSIVARVPLYRIRDDHPSQYTSELLEKIEWLKKNRAESAGGGYCNHHVIPHSLCYKSRLVIEAERLKVFNKDGDDNLMRLPYDFHIKHHAQHSKYYQILSDFLADQWTELKKMKLENDRYEIRETLLGVVNLTKEKLRKLMKEGKTIGDFE